MGIILSVAMSVQAAETPAQIVVRIIKFAGLLAGGLTGIVTSMRTIQPLAWDRWTLQQKAIFRCLVPGMVSCIPAGKWFGSEGPAPATPYFGFMIAFAVVCLRHG